MAKRKKSQIKGAPPWLVTMGDMNNLLMCFFIVLMGDVTEVVKEEFLFTMTSFRGSIGVMTGGKTFTKGRLAEMGHNTMSLPSESRGRQLNRSLKKALELLQPEVEAKKIRVSEDERGLVITLASDSFFEPGSAMLRPDTRQILRRLSQIIRQTPNFVRIEGHTDSYTLKRAARDGGYETNWELSGARSINVLRYMTEDEKVNPVQVSAVAFGEFRPIDDNDTPEGRAYNRRVDIVILKETFIEKSLEKRIPRPLPDEEWRR